jgi:hypothetical protein
MTYISLIASAIGIACWNILAAGVEYYLMLRIYKLVPALSKRKLRHGRSSGARL